MLSTLRDAHDRDYRVVVLADASADSHSDVHDFLIEKIFPQEAQVITIAELPALLSAGSVSTHPWGCSPPGVMFVRGPST